MHGLMEMSTEEILRAIDYCEDTGTNLTSHGQTDDYLASSLKMASVYREELKRREKGENTHGKNGDYR